MEDAELVQNLSAQTILNVLLGIAALVAIPTFGYFLFDRYRPISFQLIKTENPPFFVRFYSPSSQLNGHTSVCIYGMELMNNSRRSVSVRKVKLKYNVHGITHIADAHWLLTTLINSPAQHTNTESAVLDLGQARVVLVGWENLGGKLSQKSKLEDSEVVRGSACFVIPENIGYESIKDVYLIIEAYNGDSSQILIKDISHDNAATFIRNEQFSLRNGEMVIPPMNTISPNDHFN